MFPNSTATSQNSTAISKVSDSSIPVDRIFERIDEVTTWISLLQSHLIFLKAKLANERKSLRNQNFADCTVVSESFYDRVSKLWTAVLKYKVDFENETNTLFNVLAPEVIGGPSKNSEMENFRRQIRELGEQITPLQIFKLEVAEDKEKLDIQLMEKRRELLKLSAEVGDKMEQAESQTHPREIQRRNLRLLKIKICRKVINCLLVRSDLNLEENPEFEDMKMRWRRHITLKARQD